MRNFTTFIFAAGLTLAGFGAGLGLGEASAASIAVSTYSASAYGTQLGTLQPNAVIQNFETLGAANTDKQVGASLATNVGSFASAGGTGTGSAHVGNGTQLATRSGNNGGRVNTTAGGTWFLDSNDTFGMSWAVSTGLQFNKIIFSLVDPNDNGARLRIAADGDGASDFELLPSAIGNGVMKLVVITFGNLVSAASVQLVNCKPGTACANTSQYVANDGFSVDDIAVGISPVPLPAGVLLLTTAMGGFAVARRLRRA